MRETTHTQEDFINFLTPFLMKFDTMSCGDKSPKHNEKMIRWMLAKFLRPAFTNFGNGQSDKEMPKIHFKSKPLNQNTEPFHKAKFKKTI